MTATAMVSGFAAIAAVPDMTAIAAPFLTLGNDCFLLYSLLSFLILPFPIPAFVSLVP